MRPLSERTWPARAPWAVAEAMYSGMPGNLERRYDPRRARADRHRRHDRPAGRLRGPLPGHRPRADRVRGGTGPRRAPREPGVQEARQGHRALPGLTRPSHDLLRFLRLQEILQTPEI